MRRVVAWVPAALAMALALALAPRARAAEAVIAVDVPAGGCPGRAEVVAALEARLPGVTRGRGGGFGPARYRLEVSHAAGDADAPLRLRALSGALVLERRLPVEARARPGEICQALAEAAALVVVRYLRDLGYRPEPAPPPPDEPSPAPPAESPAAVPRAPATPTEPAATPPPGPPATTPAAAAPAPARPELTAAARASAASGSAVSVPGPTSGYLGASGGVRMGLGNEGSTADVTRAEVAVALQISGRWWQLEIGGGVSSQTRLDVSEVPGAELRLRAFPLRASFGVPVALGGGQLVPLGGLSVDLLSFQAAGLADARSGVRVEPAAELGAGYRRAGPGWFWRVHAGAGLSLRPRDFAAQGQMPTYRSPAMYLRGLVEVGPVLWKN